MAEEPGRSAESVAVVGSVHLDLVATAARLPRRGETMPGDAFAIHPGGKGGNQAVQVALAGVGCRFVGRVGRDAFGDQLRQALAAKGVDVSFLGVDLDAPTGASSVLAETGGDYASIVVPGAGWRLTPDCLAEARDAIAGSAVLLCQLELRPETVAAAIRIAKAAGRLVVLNAAPVPDQPLPAEFWRGVDVLVANAGEAASLAGLPRGEADSPMLAPDLRLRLGVETVIVTLGRAGAVLADGGGEARYDGHEVPVVDTIGAGDAFAGALAAELARGRGVREALPFAMAAGALAVTRAGAYEALPTRGAIGRFLADKEGWGRDGPADPAPRGGAGRPGCRGAACRTRRAAGGGRRARPRTEIVELRSTGAASGAPTPRRAQQAVPLRRDGRSGRRPYGEDGRGTRRA